MESETAMPAATVEGNVQMHGKLARLAWSVLGYNVLVVLWGAYVRASGSGAGCGAHWPLCNGEVVPTPKSVATVIEAAHRATSGIAVIAVVVLLVSALVALPKGHKARRGAIFSTVFIFGEALIGAGLVLFELVAHDASMKRALSMTLHLGNTFLLLGALALTAWWISTTGRPSAVVTPPAALRRPLLRGALALSLLATLFLGASGAIAALGDTLFPASSLREGIAQDLSPVAHAFLRLRVLHPFIALGTGILVLAAAGIVRSMSTSARAHKLSRAVTLIFMAQFAAGVLNLTLLAPIPMQLLHLLLAEATWIALVLMAWEAAIARPSAAPVKAPSSSSVLAA